MSISVIILIVDQDGISVLECVARNVTLNKASLPAMNFPDYVKEIKVEVCVPVIAANHVTAVTSENGDRFDGALAGPFFNVPRVGRDYNPGV